MSDAHSVMERAKNIEELAHVRLAVENCGLRQKSREEDGVAGSQVYLLLELRNVAGNGVKKDPLQSRDGSCCRLQ